MNGSLWRGMLVGTLVLLFASSATAQSIWNFEFMGGFNMSKLRGDDTDARLAFSDEDIGAGEITGDIDGTKIGFSAGALVTVGLNENFGIQSGILWGRRGGDGEVTIRGDIPGLGIVDLSADVTVTLDYIDIPILGVFTFPAGETMSVRAMVGPVLAFNSNAEVEISVAGGSGSEDIGDVIKSVDVQGLLGAGLVFHLTNINFIVDGRFALGFSSVDDSGADLDIKNGGFTLMAGLGIPLNP